ncbi:ATP-binding cassette domain-containing protein [Alsobacter soli]|uniref:ATP-binding cassette domain-containing protein n=1 Tax=Alsobacter soli TaxID=2109933 RepID=UPI001304BF9D|nr:ATP-binding cassette domain-containing protein [Alsobacter soli]
MHPIRTLAASWLRAREEQPRETRAQPQGEAPAPRRGGLFSDIDSVASAWFGQRWFGGDRAPPGTPTPEELATAASARGIEVSYATRKLSALQDQDFPCVILLKDGSSVVLAGRIGRDRLLRKTDRGVEDVPVEDLAASHSGVVFFVAPNRSPAATDPAAPEDDREEAPATTLLHAVWGEILKRHKGRLLQLCAAAAVINLLSLALPLFSMSVYDRVIPHLAMETLWALVIGVSIALGLDLALRAIRLKIADAIGLGAAASVQARIYARLLGARLGEKPAAAGGVQTALREVEALAQLLPNLVVSVAVDGPFFLLALALLAALGGPVAWAPVAAILAITAVQALGKVRGDKSAEAARLSATQANLLLETVAGAETVKLTGAVSALMRRWERLVDAAAFVGHTMRLHAAFSAQAAMTISQAAIAVAIVLGVHQIADASMTIGALSACTMLIGRIISPLSMIGSQLLRLAQALRSAKAVEALLNAPQDVAQDPTSGQRPIRGELVFKGAGFTYPGEKAPVLRDINLTIAPGEKVGLIGRAGSGKSTLLRLMLRLYDVDAGALLLDGHDIRQVAPDRLRRHFGFMRQDVSLFDDTLRNAICFGLDEVRQDDFERVAALAGVRDFAARHPEGYGLRVGPRGERLSGGERQSVMLARTLLGAPQALIMDEPTAAMDNTTELRIVRDLRDWIGDRTLIIATHRAPMLGLVDRLVWIEEGRIVADGPKDTVLRALAGGTTAA